MQYLGISLLVVVFVFLQCAFAEQTPEGIFSGKGPIKISAHSLRADQKKGITIFEGSVVARQGETTLMADRMELYTDQDGKISRIVASGNVVLKRGPEEISAQQAEYIYKREVIIFTGQPVARSKDTTVRGKKIIYHTTDGSTMVEDAHVTIQKEDRRGEGSQGRRSQEVLP